MKQIILASQSPRRQDLLAKMGVTFTAIPSDFDEHLDNNRPATEVAMELGLGKVMAVARKYPDAIVIGGDTIVSVDNRQLGKPRDRADALETLEWLAGKCNIVTTSIVVVCLADDVQIMEAPESKVFFKPFDKQKVEAYLDTGDYADKAGSYGIQSGFAPLVDYIEGEYDTIIGLPTKRLAHILQELGIEAHPAGIVSPLPVKKS